MKRNIVINFNDGTKKYLELTKATMLKGSFGMIHIDEMKEGWRLLFSEDIIQDFSKIKSFEIERED